MFLGAQTKPQANVSELNNPLEREAGKIRQGFGPLDGI